MNSIRGFIRDLRPRYPASGQRNLLVQHDVQTIYEEGGRKAKGTRDDLTRSLRKGDVVAVVHAFLLADPARRDRRGSYWLAVDEIESRGASIWEIYSGLRSTDAKQRDMIHRAAIEALARGRHKRSEADKRGRPPWEPSETEKLKAEVIWRNAKHTWTQAVAELRKLDKRWTATRAYRLFGKRNAD